MRGIFSLFLLILTISCGNVDRLNTAEIKEKMGNYKIKKIAPAEIVTHLNTKGKELQKEIEGFGAISCHEAKSKIDSIAKANKINIVLVDILEIDLEKVVNKKEKLLYEAYIYDYQNKRKAANNAQKVDAENCVYTFGLKEQSPLTNCEGRESNYRYFWKATWTQAELIRSM